MSLIRIGTDGACEPNPGIGGYGIVIEIAKYETIKLKQGYRKTTNNRMELLAIIKAVEYCISQKWLKNSLLIFSDSRYTIKSFTEWSEKWQVNGWKNANKKPVENQDLIKYFLKIAKPFGNRIILEYIPGHSGFDLNEQSDQLAREAIQGELLIDSNYETNNFETYRF
jgi:ribonuclease HI